jgi:hypothetical protein
MITVGVSYFEVVGSFTIFSLFIIFDIIAVVHEDDGTDFFMLIVFSLITLSVIGFFVGVGFVKGYYFLTPVSGGEIRKRLSINDILNFFLCFLRIVLCLTRYIFYDIQVEHVDMVLQYTEDIGYGFDLESNFFIFLSMKLLFAIVDLFLYVYMLCLCLFKFGIALFLLWLILDLILLRVDTSSDQL